MLQYLRQRLRDMRTLSTLCRSAERHALAEGQDEPAAEHFLLASLDLADGSARRAFERLQADPGAVRAAITRQHLDALQGLGMDADVAGAIDAAAALPGPTRALYRAKPSGQAVLRDLSGQRVHDKAAPLLGAHVVVAVVAARRGIPARALACMGVDLDALGNAARAEIAARSGVR